jgi:hypothetical protein
MPNLADEDIVEVWNLCQNPTYSALNQDGSPLDPSVFLFDQEIHKLMIADSVDNTAAGTYDLGL